MLEVAPRPGKARSEADEAVLCFTMQSRLHWRSGSLGQRFTREIGASSEVGKVGLLVGDRRLGFRYDFWCCLELVRVMIKALIPC